MSLFENDRIHVSRILTVERYESKNDPIAADGKRHYSSNPLSNELIFFVSGDDLCTFDDAEMHDIAGAIRYIPKGRIAGSYTVAPICDGECYDIYFDTAECTPRKASVHNDMAFLENDFVRLYKLWQGKKPGYYAQCLSILYHIIAAFQSAAFDYMPSRQKSRFDAMNDYILAHCLEYRFDYPALAKLSGYRYSYFSEQFRRYYHLSPVRYVTKLKVDSAKEMLITKRYSISEIAEKCGFENVYYFSNVFMKHTGVRPKEYCR